MKHVKMESIIYGGSFRHRLISSGGNSPRTFLQATPHALLLGWSTKIKRKGRRERLTLHFLLSVYKDSNSLLPSLGMQFGEQHRKGVEPHSLPPSGWGMQPAVILLQSDEVQESMEVGQIHIIQRYFILPGIHQEFASYQVSQGSQVFLLPWAPSFVHPVLTFQQKSPGEVLWVLDATLTSLLKISENDEFSNRFLMPDICSTD